MGPDARDASRRAGQAMVKRQVAWLGNKAKELVTIYETVKPAVRLRSFAEVETLWRDIVAPALPGFLSMQLDPRKTGRSVSKESRWWVNWKAGELYQP